MPAAAKAPKKKKLTRAGAARANGRKSHGPRTLAGKQRSSLNGFKHGLRSSRVVIPGESLEIYNTLLHRYNMRYLPRDQNESDLVTDMLNNRWRSRRCQSLEPGLYTATLYETEADIHRRFPNPTQDMVQALVYEKMHTRSRFVDENRRAESRFNREYERAYRLLDRLLAQQLREPVLPEELDAFESDLPSNTGGPVDLTAQVIDNQKEPPISTTEPNGVSLPFSHLAALVTMLFAFLHSRLITFIQFQRRRNNAKPLSITMREGFPGSPMRLLICSLAALLICFGQGCFGQALKKLDPVTWRMEFVPPDAKPGGWAVAKLTATIEEPWHLYSPTTPAGGPIVSKIGLAESENVEAVEVHRPQPVRKFDPNFSLDTETYEKTAVFYLRIRLKPQTPVQPLELTANVRYQACTEKECLPPVRRNAAATVRVKASAAESAFAPPTGYVLVTPAPARQTPQTAAPPAAPKTGSDLLGFAFLAFGLGLAAVFTPCVFPMIPFTVSVFIRNNSVLQAAVYAGGIVLFFTSFGLIITAVVGPFGVVQLGSNPWVNGVITVVFFAFALSLLGAFEITLPSSLLTKMDQASQRQGGVLGSLLMGLTFALTSFACVGPFMGSLLAASVQGDKLQPAIGMMAFSSGLASPFFFLALFPKTLSRMPKSGGWLPRVKTVLGFVLLAGALKYAANVDQVLQWNVLTRERFLAAWVVLFAMAGLYLLGILRMEGINKDENVGTARALIGATLLIFAVSLIPGMFGGRLGELDAYVPLPAEGGFGSGGGSGSGGEKLAWMKNQYKEALAKAKAENKLLFINFTGYACTNCHWMKSNMFPRPEVIAEMKNFVLLELYTDGTDDDSTRNQDLQNSRFSTIAIPFYVLMDGDEKVIASFPGLTKKPEEFLAFLRSGLKS